MQTLRKVWTDTCTRLARLAHGPDVSRTQVASRATVVQMGLQLRDHLDQLLADKVFRLDDFAWFKLLKMQWHESTQTCHVRQCFASLRYGYEFLGAGSRLVLTPATDRALLTLTTALHLHHFGGLAGAPGVGKTHTVAELAALAGRMLLPLRFNHRVSYDVIGRFLRGMAQSGVWCCFDELLDLGPAVLSVLAAQLHTIRRAIVQRVPRLVVQGREITLNPSCAVFMTLQLRPTAEHTALPDTMRALFRTAHLPCPSLPVVVTAMLAAGGFADPATLAHRLLLFLELLQQREAPAAAASPSLRALKELLRDLQLRHARCAPGDDAQLVAQALLDYYGPHCSDTASLRQVLRAAHLPFPTTAVAAARTRTLSLSSSTASLAAVPVTSGTEDQATMLAAEALAHHPLLSLSPHQQRTALQLHAALAVPDQAVLLVGSPAVGKSTTLRALAESLPGPVSPTVRVVNPQALGSARVFGEFAVPTGEWRAGLLPQLVQPGPADDRLWLVVDGAMEVAWLDAMAPALADERMLCLLNGEQLFLGLHTRLIFEQTDLHDATPAVLARCRLVLIEAWPDQAHVLVQAWARDVFLAENDLPPPVRTQLAAFAVDLCSRSLARGVQFVGLHESADVVSVVRLLCGLMQALALESSDVFQYQDGDNVAPLKTAVARIFAFAYIWALGGRLAAEPRRAEFDQFFRHLLQDIKLNVVHIPQARSVFGYVLEHGAGSNFVPWENLQPPPSSLPGSDADALLATLWSSPEWLAHHTVLRLCARVGLSVLLLGPPGAGKTALAQDFAAQYTVHAPTPTPLLSVQMAPFTTGHQLEQLFESHTSKRGGSSPARPDAFQRLLLVVDDLHVAQTPGTSASPAQVLRQVLEHQSLLDSESLQRAVPPTVVVATARAPLRARRLAWRLAVLAVQPPAPAAAFLSMAPVMEARWTQSTSAWPGAMPLRPNELAHHVGQVLTAWHERVAQHTAPALLDRWRLRRLLRLLCTIDAAQLPPLPALVSALRWEVLGWAGHTPDAGLPPWASQLSTERLAQATPDHVWCTVPPAGSTVPAVAQVVDWPQLQARVRYWAQRFTDQAGRAWPVLVAPHVVAAVSALHRAFTSAGEPVVLVGHVGAGKRTVAELACFMAQRACYLFTLEQDCQQFRRMLAQAHAEAAASGRRACLVLSGRQFGSAELLRDICAAVHGQWEQLAMPAPSAAARARVQLVLCVTPAQGPELMALLGSPWPVRLGAWTPAALHQAVEQHGLPAAQLARALAHVQTDEAAAGLATYLEAARTFQMLRQQHRPSVQAQHAQWADACQALQQLKHRAAVLDQQRAALQPQLTGQRARLDAAAEQTAADGERVRGRQAAVAEREAAAHALEQALASEQASMRQSLGHVLKELQTANKGLRKLDKNGLAELRQYSNPPEMVRAVMDSVCLLLEREATWATVRTLLADANFGRQLAALDLDAVPDRAVRQLNEQVVVGGFDPVAMGSVSVACKSICQWVLMVNQYLQTLHSLGPQRRQVRQLSSQVQAARQAWQQQVDELTTLQAQCQGAQLIFEREQSGLAQLAEQDASLQSQLEVLQDLLQGLKPFEQQWRARLAQAELELPHLDSYLVVAAVALACFGRRTPAQRQTLLAKMLADVSWPSARVQQGLQDVMAVVAPEPTGAPRLSSATGALGTRELSECLQLAVHGLRWPLIEDPEGRARAWLEAHEQSRGLMSATSQDSDLAATLCLAMEGGRSLLVRLFTTTLPPVLIPVVLLPRRRTGVQRLVVGGKLVTCSPHFNMYLLTDAVPASLAEHVQPWVTVVDGELSAASLQAHFLQRAFELEQRDQDEKRAVVAAALAEDQSALHDVQQAILDALLSDPPTADGALADQVHYAAENMQALTTRISAHQAQLALTGQVMQRYESVAQCAAVMFAEIRLLRRLNPLYHLSLDAFNKMFTAVVEAEMPEHPKHATPQHFAGLEQRLLRSVMDSVSRGIFTQHHLIFALRVCAALQLARGQGLTQSEWAFVSRVGDELVGQQATDGSQPEPTAGPGASPAVRAACAQLQHEFPAVFGQLLASLAEDATLWTEFTLDTCPVLREAALGPRWAHLGAVHRLMLVRALMPEKLVDAVKDFVSLYLGPSFIRRPVLDLERTLLSSWASHPLLLVSGAGGDATVLLERFAQEQGCFPHLKLVAMAPGQEVQAQAALARGLAHGHWVYLQNVELVPAWLPWLVAFVSRDMQKPQHARSTFRLWLSVSPEAVLPQHLLQHCIKLVLEPAGGLRTNMLNAIQRFAASFGAGVFPTGEDAPAQALNRTRTFDGSIPVEQLKHLSAGRRRSLAQEAMDPAVGSLGEGGAEARSPGTSPGTSPGASPGTSPAVLRRASGTQKTMVSSALRRTSLIRRASALQDPESTWTSTTSSGSDGSATGERTITAVAMPSSRIEDIPDDLLEPWRGLVFALCLFHSVVQERTRYGALGWNAAPQFGSDDLYVAGAVLHDLLIEFGVGAALWRPLQYMTSELIYGSACEDPHDRARLQQLAAKLLCADLLVEGFALNKAGEYLVPPLNYSAQVQQKKR